MALAHQLVFLGQQVVHELLLDLEEFFGAAPKGGAVADLIVAGVQVPQHELNGIQGWLVVPDGRLAFHSDPGLMWAGAQSATTGPMGLVIWSLGSSFCPRSDSKARFHGSQHG